VTAGSINIARHHVNFGKKKWHQVEKWFATPRLEDRMILKVMLGTKLRTGFN
jgi:hypothetical protein